jgi:hypothetical protein
MGVQRSPTALATVVRVQFHWQHVQVAMFKFQFYTVCYIPTGNRTVPVSIEQLITLLEEIYKELQFLDQLVSTTTLSQFVSFQVSSYPTTINQYKTSKHYHACSFSNYLFVIVPIIDAMLYSPFKIGYTQSCYHSNGKGRRRPGAGTGRA